MESDTIAEFITNLAILFGTVKTDKFFVFQIKERYRIELFVLRRIRNRQENLFGMDKRFVTFGIVEFRSVIRVSANADIENARFFVLHNVHVDI